MLSWNIDQDTETVLSVSVIIGDQTVLKDASDLDHISRFEKPAVRLPVVHAVAETAERDERFANA